MPGMAVWRAFRRHPRPRPLTRACRVGHWRSPVRPAAPFALPPHCTRRADAYRAGGHGPALLDLAPASRYSFHTRGATVRRRPVVRQRWRPPDAPDRSSDLPVTLPSSPHRLVPARRDPRSAPALGCNARTPDRTATRGFVMPAATRGEPDAVRRASYETALPKCRLGAAIRARFKSGSSSEATVSPMMDPDALPAAGRPNDTHR